MTRDKLLVEAQELEAKLLGFVFKERDEKDELDWDAVNELVKERDALHRELAEDGELTSEEDMFLRTAYENTKLLQKLAGEVQELTQQELIKIEKGRKANQAYY